MEEKTEIEQDIARTKEHTCVDKVEKFGKEIDVVLNKKPQKGCMPNIINKYDIVQMSSKAEWFTLSIEKEYQKPE